MISHSRTTAWQPPPGPDALAMPVGEDWDAIKVRRDYGIVAMSFLGEASGAVMGDPYGGCFYFLIPPNSGMDWSFPEAARVVHLSVACWVTVPPRERCRPPGPHWVVPFREGRYLADPRRLHEALASITGLVSSPREREQR